MTQDRRTPRLERLITIAEVAFVSSFFIGIAPMLVEGIRLFDGLNVIKLSIVFYGLRQITIGTLARRTGQLTIQVWFGLLPVGKSELAEKQARSHGTILIGVGALLIFVVIGSLGLRFV